MVDALRHSKAAQITSQARKRRYERQTKEALDAGEVERRAELVSESFMAWSFGDETIPMYKVNTILLK